MNTETNSAATQEAPQMAALPPVDLGDKLPVWNSETATYKAVNDLLKGSRVTFPDADTLTAALAKLANDLPLAVAGNQKFLRVGDFFADDAPALPPAGSAGYVLAQVGRRGVKSEDGTTKNGVCGVMIYPAISLSDVRAHEKGDEYLAKLHEKEAGLIAFRTLDAGPKATLAEFAASAVDLPTTVSDLVERSQSGGSIHAVFVNNWKAFRDFFAAQPQFAPVAKLLPSQGECLKCIRSASYARRNQPALEERDLFARIGRMFVATLNQMNAARAEAGEEPIAGDPNAVLTWIEDRDTLDIDPPAKIEDDAATLAALDAFGSI